MNMNNKPDGGQAYPLVYLSKGTKIEDGVLHIEMKGDNGMTLRDYFAGQALAGMMSAWYERHEGEEGSTGTWPHSAMEREQEREQVAEDCYNMSDAMIAARDK